MTSIIANEHLCPIPNTARPITWQLDAALRLHPMPDALVLADRCEAYEARKEGLLSVNPSPFPVDFSFVCYQPMEDILDWKRLPADE